jgi:hypothetical protein
VRCELENSAQEAGACPYPPDDSGIIALPALWRSQKSKRVYILLWKRWSRNPAPFAESNAIIYSGTDLEAQNAEDCKFAVTKVVQNAKIVAINAATVAIFIFGVPSPIDTSQQFQIPVYVIVNPLGRDSPAQSSEDDDLMQVLLSHNPVLRAHVRDWLSSA